MCARLVRLGVVLVAVERPDGLLIERLLDAGLAVIAVHPNQVKAMRPRYSVAAGKSDGFDSFVLAELARTDSHRFRVLVPDGDQTKALRAMTGPERISCAPGWGWPTSCATSWPAFGRAPARCSGRSTRRSRWSSCAVIRARSTRAGWASSAWPRFSPATTTPAASPHEILGRLRTGADGRAGELEMRARRQIVLGLVDALEPIVTAIRQLTVQIRQAVDDHPDGQTFRSLFIAPDSVLCAATMIAEIGDCRDRYPSYRALAADGGQAPVAVESGKAKHAQFRWACDHRLREAFCVLADSSRHHNPWAADIYDRACDRGASHQRAARILGRSWCQVIWRLWQDHDTYDPARQRLEARAV